MQNWSGHIKWEPSQIFYPQTEEAITSIVHQALENKKSIRLIGSAHSFMPLSFTQDFLISLDKFQGLIKINQEQKRVTVKAGTKLHQLNDLLHQKGLALPNMGDINSQSIAGAISTGTHGTGTAFGNMSTQITKIKFINGLGEIITCSPEQSPQLFKAAQISLGSLGIILEITLQCVSSYKLELILDKNTLDSVLNNYTQINAETRNFEFYWFPNTKYVMTKKVNITDKEPDKSSFKNYLQEVILENYGFLLVNELVHKFPSLTHPLSRFSANTTSLHKKVHYSHQVFTTPRMVKFNEMEYNVPMDAYKTVKKELVNWINKNNKNIVFPLENRFVKGDDIFLSPAYGRDSAYIAAHVYHKKDFQPFFKALEEILRAHDGRPHWGKRNTLVRKDFAQSYPAFETFVQIRKEQDPDGIFLSDYLKTIFVE